MVVAKYVQPSENVNRPGPTATASSGLTVKTTGADGVMSNGAKVANNGPLMAVRIHA